MSLVETLMRTQLRTMLQRAVLLVDDMQTAEECVADAFLALHVAVQKGAVDDEQGATAYLRTCVLNAARSILRRRRTHRSRRHLLLLPDEPSAELTALGTVIAAERSRDVVAAVRELPQRQREIVVLMYFDGLSVAEVAASLEVSEGTVKSTAFDARARLAQHLGHLR